MRHPPDLIICDRMMPVMDVLQPGPCNSRAQGLPGQDTDHRMHRQCPELKITSKRWRRE
ncbi:hypothetical protein ACU4GD_18685 [Cupriavidus basilensis]